MLVLSRKRRQAIQITTPIGTIRIVPVRVDGRIVRLGIEAPRDCHIVREELLADQSATRTESPQAA